MTKTWLEEVKELSAEISKLDLEIDEFTKQVETEPWCDDFSEKLRDFLEKRDGFYKEFERLQNNMY